MKENIVKLCTTYITEHNQNAGIESSVVIQTRKMLIIMFVKKTDNLNVIKDVGCFRGSNLPQNLGKIIPYYCIVQLLLLNFSAQNIFYLRL